MREWRINRQENLQDVLDVAPPGTVIRLPAGVIRQKAVICTPGITLIGAGRDRTTLVFDRCAKDMDNVGRPLGTFRSFTMAVTAENVTLRGLTVANDAGDPGQKGQQVALSVYGDSFVMEDGALLSTQDTLFLGPLPPDLRRRYRDLLPEELRRPEPLSARFQNCRIAGSVDFVFGGGAAIFDGCEILSVSDGRSVGYVAAPAHDLSQTDGFTFRRCRFTADPDVAINSVYLARPWRDHGLAVFEDCAYGPHIHPAGFDRWGTTHRNETARFYETPGIAGRVDWVR
ncbi:MAG: pectin esterase [Clostridia bacterium]|nr:pectin esterase [Clostridia bacterium]MBR0356664.1 pectin esterase [Clostridia bacterium]